MWVWKANTHAWKEFESGNHVSVTHYSCHTNLNSSLSLQVWWAEEKEPGPLYVPKMVELCEMIWSWHKFRHIPCRVDWLVSNNPPPQSNYTKPLKVVEFHTCSRHFLMWWKKSPRITYVSLVVTFGGMETVEGMHLVMKQFVYLFKFR